jgi:DNA-binding CsgD family transcriptional regulator
MALLDGDYKFLHMSPVHHGYPNGTDIVGTMMCDWGYTPDDRDQLFGVLGSTLKEPGDIVNVGFRWKFDSLDSFFFVLQNWHKTDVGAVQYASHTWIFTRNLGWLTDTEREVLHALGTGSGVKGTAEELGKALSTVRTHLNSIRDKLELDSMEQLYVFATAYTSAGGFDSELMEDIDVQPPSRCTVNADSKDSLDS